MLPCAPPSCRTTSRSPRSSRAGSAPPYNSWYVGSVAEVNKRRTKMENVSVEFKDDTYGVTRGTFVAEADTYGADKFWVVLNPIPIKSRSTWRRTRVMSSLARLRPQPASQPASQPTCHALDHALVPGVSQARSLSVGRGQV